MDASAIASAEERLGAVVVDLDAEFGSRDASSLIRLETTAVHKGLELELAGLALALVYHYVLHRDGRLASRFIPTVILNQSRTDDSSDADADQNRNHQSQPDHRP